MIEMQDVIKKYPNGVLAVDGININIKAGEFVYVVGPSGAGKSTFIKMVYREEKPTSGNIVIDGVNLSKLKESKVPFLRRNIGVVFQDFKLLPQLTVYENVAFALEVIEESPKNIKKRVMEVLDLVKLKHKARHLPNELSGGEQQRISIARAILKNAPVILLDEATSSLDPENEAEMQEAINRLIKGRTVIMIAHRLKTVVRADNIIVLDKGHVVDQGRHEELIRKDGLYSRLWELQTETSGWKIAEAGEAIY
jgi:cell division transport system ATP-binding protein